MHKKVNKKVLLLLWKKINKNRSQNIIKASAFYKIQNFFLFLFKQTFFWYMSKMYLWMLTLVTLFDPKVAGEKVHPRWNQNSRAHAVTAWISLWHHGAVHAVCACFSLCDAILACIGLWHHRPMHARTAWDLKFQVWLGYTFTPATLIWPYSCRSSLPQFSNDIYIYKKLPLIV